MFFERVAKLPRIVNIGAMKIQTHSSDQTEPMLKVQGTATTFRFLNTEPDQA